MKHGEILLVNYPFTDHSGAKLRPALVVSQDGYNTGEDFVIVPISSAPSPNDPYAVRIEATHAAFSQTGLRQASSIKWTKPITVSRRVVQRRLGIVPSDLLARVQAGLVALFTNR